MTAHLTVVGIGADGFDGLRGQARDALASAPLVVGSTRQLDLLPEAATAPGARRLAWPSPLEPLLDELAAGEHGDAAILASGDPMLHGIGSSLARRLDEQHDGRASTEGGDTGRGHGQLVPATFTVLPHLSAFTLACARLHWPVAETELVSTVARAPEIVARALQPGRRLVVYVTGREGAARLAEIVTARGFGPSRFVVLEQLGGPAERIEEATAESWDDREADPLHAVAIEPRPAPDTRPLATTPGLPDDAFDHDGQLTKRHVRSVTLAALAPLPGELLWDIGAGSGSIAIEWLRAAPRTRAIAFEADPARAARIVANAHALGVPELHVIEGHAPGTLPKPRSDAPGATAPNPDEASARAPVPADTAALTPDAIFIGGGLTAQGLLDTAWAALKRGGRIVANAVTLESQALLLEARNAHGGTLTQIAISHAEPVGGFTGWRAQMPVVQWEAHKRASEEEPSR